MFVLEDATIVPAEQGEQVYRNLWERLNDYSSPEEQKKYSTEQERIARDNDIVELKKMLYGYECQICGWSCRTKNGGNYIEGAHIKSKKDDGTEHPSNILILCPNHHKMFDDGQTTYEMKDDKVVNLVINGVDLKIKYLEPPT